MHGHSYNVLPVRLCRIFHSSVAGPCLDPRCRGQTLESYLIMPVQRVPRYKLLLEELKRKTNVGHVGYESLCKAIQEVNVAAKHINETIRHKEQREQLAKLETKFVGHVDLRDCEVREMIC